MEKLSTQGQKRGLEGKSSQRGTDGRTPQGTRAKITVTAAENPTGQAKQNSRIGEHAHKNGRVNVL